MNDKLDYLPMLRILKSNEKDIVQYLTSRDMHVVFVRKYSNSGIEDPQSRIIIFPTAKECTMNVG